MKIVTAALPYVNNFPHLGHIVGSHLPADIFARFCRLKGYETIFVGGTDEHGTPSEIAALERNISPRQLCNYFYKVHKEIYRWFNIGYDNFSRTSRRIHHKTTQEFFKLVYQKGYIFEKEMVLPYCLSCERFLPDRYIVGKCPFCGSAEARGDQCEKCGKLLDPNQLKEFSCAICKKGNIEFRKSKHLFLDLSKLEKELKEWIEGKKHWRHQVRNAALGWIKEGLKPRSITRDLRWGIKVPLRGYKDKVFYVWFEAPIGYISATREYLPNKWKKYWRGPKSQIYHFVGKDNIPFHTIFWPASLMAHGGFNLPYNVVGLQYLNYEGQKFSKRRGWGVFCENLPRAGLNSDYWRFYLSFLIPETSDTDFKWEEFKDKINGELIGNFSNFFHRNLSIVYKSFNKEIKRQSFKNLSRLDKELIEETKKAVSKIDDLMEKIELRGALKEILNLSSKGNRYFDHKTVWKLIKENRREAEKTLLICLSLCKILTVLIQPFLPETAKKAWKQLGLKGKVSEKGNFKKTKEFTIKSFEIEKPEILFEKLDNKKIELLKKITTKT